jgi:hypothetical protein
MAAISNADLEQISGGPVSFDKEGKIRIPLMLLKREQNSYLVILLACLESSIFCPSSQCTSLLPDP